MVERILEQEVAIRSVLSSDCKTSHLVPTWKDIDGVNWNTQHLIKINRTHPLILGSLVIRVLICVKLNHCHAHFWCRIFQLFLLMYFRVFTMHSPCTDLTDILSGEKYITVSAIFPILSLIEKHYSKSAKQKHN